MNTTSFHASSHNSLSSRYPVSLATFSSSPPTAHQPHTPSSIRPRIKIEIKPHLPPTETRPIDTKQLELRMAPRLLACFGRVSADSAAEEHRLAGPVVVELFSSQGCGTSPEAEAIATRLGRGEIIGADAPVLVLAFHVDYWDYRGWKDPFGSSAWTVRQKAYVESMRLDALYTPQIVVQGRAQCLGNEEGSVAAAVRDAPRFPSPAMQATFSKPSPMTLQVVLSGPLRSKIDSTGANVMVALYQSGLVINIDKGENKGRLLANDYVVRCLEKLTTVKDISAKKSISGTINFLLWEGFNPAKCGLVLFIHNPSLHIFGAQQFAIPDNL